MVVHEWREELGADSLLQPPPSAPPASRPWAPASLVARLARYDWPGNVRQLANVARRLAVARRAGGALALEPFIESLLASDSRPAEASAPAVPEPGHRR